MTVVALTLPRRTAARLVPNARWRHAIGLVLVLARKNVKIRYKRTSLGVIWAAGQPLLQALVLTVVFTRVLRRWSVPDFGLYVLCGVMPYSAMSSGIQHATTSVVENASLLKKVAVPRLVFPLAAIGCTLTVFGASLVVLLAASLTFGHIGVRTVALLPLALLAVVLLATSVGVLGASLHVQYRDVKFMLESALLMLFYASPIFYTSDLLGDAAKWQRLNPATGVLSLMRGALAGLTVDWIAVGCTAAFCALVLPIGLYLFQRRSQTFADLT